MCRRFRNETLCHHRHFGHALTLEWTPTHSTCTFNEVETVHWTCVTRILLRIFSSNVPTTQPSFAELLDWQYRNLGRIGGIPSIEDPTRYPFANLKTQVPWYCLSFVQQIGWYRSDPRSSFLAHMLNYKWLRLIDVLFSSDILSLSAKSWSRTETRMAPIAYNLHFDHPRVPLLKKFELHVNCDYAGESVEMGWEGNDF